MTEQDVQDTPQQDTDATDEAAPVDAAPAAGTADATADASVETAADDATDAADHDADAGTSDDDRDVEDDADAADGVVDAADDAADGDTDDVDGDDAGGEDTASGRGSRSRSNGVGRLEREGEVAADFLETLLDIADLDGDIDVDVDGDRAAVAVVDSDEGRVPRRMIGRDGEVLEALQELTRLAVQSATGERSRLMLDVGGHRAARREALVGLASAAIESVKSSGERQELEPMTAFERKVVHDAVLAAGLSSESEGAEPNRFVVVLPA